MLHSAKNNCGNKKGTANEKNYLLLMFTISVHLSSVLLIPLSNCSYKTTTSKIFKRQFIEKIIKENRILPTYPGRYDGLILIITSLKYLV